MTDVYLTILIPAYNEAKRLSDTLRKIEDYCRASIKEAYEVLIVDDGSTDTTVLLLEELKSQYPNLRLHHYKNNQGKGYALRTGMRLASGKFVLFSDADLSTPIEEMQSFLKKLNEGTQVVIATRKRTGAHILKRQPLWRESMGKTFTWLSNLILGLNFSDHTCGFKAFEVAAGKDIFSRQRIRGWAYDSEILFLATRSHYNVCEIPVRWMNSPESKVRAFRAVFTSLAALLLIRWNWITGKYLKAD
ncbi:glycosyltransferase family 2 protein [bacterium]|nr:glycosyltransferase family 2 protein [bacterium]